MPPPLPIVLDTDLGADPDDALALLLALASPEVDLIAVTVVDGDLDLRAAMAARLLGLAGRADVPVVKGRRHPLGTGRGPTMLGTEGQGLLDIDDAGPTAPILDTPAPEWLVDQARQTPFHLVAIGPPTNVAAALHLDPAFAQRLTGLTIMGGSLGATGFPPAWQRAIRWTGLDPATYDHNTASDPEAALVCARSGIPTTWVPIDVTFHAPLHRTARDRFHNTGTALGQALARMLDLWHDRWLRPALPPPADPASPPTLPDAVAFLHDLLTVASLFPGPWLRLRPAVLRPAIAGGLFHLYEDNRAPAAATVATHVDGPNFERFCVDRIVQLLEATPGRNDRSQPTVPPRP